MPQVVGVKLRFAPKILWFDPAGAQPAEGDTVIVETERGTEVGLIAQASHEVAESDLPAPLKRMVRIASDEDLVRIDEFAEKEREAMPVFRQLVSESKLDMKAIDVEYLFGGDKVVFYFVAEERVDFRDLVKELASRFRTRIDMRQIGVRDEARMVGGLGHCGEQLCCVRFGGEFQPVSIRMAKEQDLPLNPLKISGLCGRLMCCLRYEYEAYKDYKGRAPKRGAIVETPIGLAKVSDLDTPRETVTMRFEDGKSATVPLSAMTCAKGTGCPCAVSREALEDAGGSGTALALAVLDRESQEPEPAPESAPPARDTARRKRRRKPGEAGAAPAEQVPTPAKPARPRRSSAEAKPVAEQTGEPATPEGSGSPKPAARRRRRRRGAGGGNKEA